MADGATCTCVRHPLKPASKRIRNDDCPVHGDEDGTRIRKHRLRRHQPTDSGGSDG